MTQRAGMKLAVKLAGGFAIMIALAVAIGIEGISNLGRMDALLKKMYTGNLAPIVDISQANVSALHHNRGAYRIILETDDAEMKNIAANGEKYLEEFKQAVESYRKALSGKEETDALAGMEAQWQAYLKEYEVMKLLAMANRNEEADAYMAAKVRPVFNKVDESMANLALLNKTYAEEVSKEGDRVYRNIEILMILILVAGAAIGAALALFITRSVTRSVGGEPDAIAEMAERISGGDLAIRDDRDRKRETTGIYKSLLAMGDRLRDIVGIVQTAVNQVAEGSEQISSTAQQMSQGATEQAASAEEVSASVEEMGATIKQNTDNALATESISQKAAKDAQQGGQVVGEAVVAIKEISGKIVIINEIASQTNLLALNAAIEAARAGEAGKGFAVVASEVRKLAERSQKAAAEITELAETTVRQAGSAGDQISNLVPDIRKTADLVQEIASASREQNTGVDQIGKAMTQLDTVIQQNASSSEELASMAEELSSQSMQLTQTMTFFKFEGSATGERGAGRSRGNASPKPAPAQESDVPRKIAAKHPAARPTAIALAKGAPSRDAEDNAFEEF
jgi:methyl-accepting chemotaxis protein